VAHFGWWINHAKRLIQSYLQLILKKIGFAEFGVEGCSSAADPLGCANDRNDITNTSCVWVGNWGKKKRCLPNSLWPKKTKFHNILSTYFTRHTWKCTFLFESRTVREIQPRTKQSDLLGSVQTTSKRSKHLHFRTLQCVGTYDCKWWKVTTSWQDGGSLHKLCDNGSFIEGYQYYVWHRLLWAIPSTRRFVSCLHLRPQLVVTEQGKSCP
jgi:hypothetical protein